MTSLKTGWKPDTRQQRDITPKLGMVGVEDRYGTLASGKKSNVDLVEHCEVRNQKSSSACVGFATSGALYARLHFLGYRTELFSAVCPYNIGRQLEGKNGRDGDKLPDVGSHPFLVMEAYRRFGIVFESALPFDAHYKERIGHEIDFDIFQKASQFRISNFARIAVSRAQRVEAIIKAIDAGRPVPFGTEVGPEVFEHKASSDPIGISDDIEGKSEGGHMMAIVGYEDDGDVLVVLNSWDTSWGDGGFGRFSRSKIEHASSTDFYDFVITDEVAPDAEEN